MSFFTRIFGDEKEEMRRLRAERDAAVQECELMRNEYMVLKDKLLEFIGAQRTLTEAASKLRDENMLLKQAIAMTTARDVRS